MDRSQRQELGIAGHVIFIVRTGEINLSMLAFAQLAFFTPGHK